MTTAPAVAEANRRLLEELNRLGFGAVIISGDDL